MVSNGLFITVACLTKAKRPSTSTRKTHTMTVRCATHPMHTLIIVALCVIHFAQVLFILIIIHCASCNNIMQFMRTFKKPIYLFKMFFVVHRRRRKKKNQPIRGVFARRKRINSTTLEKHVPSTGLEIDSSASRCADCVHLFEHT